MSATSWVMVGDRCVTFIVIRDTIRRRSHSWFFFLQISLYRVALLVHNCSSKGHCWWCECRCATTLDLHPILLIECDEFFNVQRVCLSFTRDLHFTSYPRDGVFWTALACIWKQKGRRSHNAQSHTDTHAHITSGFNALIKSLSTIPEAAWKYNR